MRWLSLAGVVLGIWILLTPWATDFSEIAWINVVCGIVIAVLCGISALTAEKA